MVRKILAFVLVVVVILASAPTHSGASTSMDSPDLSKHCDTYFNVEGYTTSHGLTMFTITHDGKPVKGATVYLNGEFYGTTGDSGKIGSHNYPKQATTKYSFIIVDGKHASQVDMKQSVFKHKQVC